MYRANDIKTGMLHLLGWRQNYDTSNFSISDSLTTSESEQYFQDIHPMLTLDNVKAIAPDFKRVTFAAWASGTSYYSGMRVTKGEVEYRAKINNIGKDPATNPNEWETFDAFSEWLEQKTQACIINAVQSFLNQKMIEKTANGILENKSLFDGAGRLTDLDPMTNSMVGFEIVPMRAKGITLKIEKIGLQLKGTGKVKLYLFHSSNPSAIKTIIVERTRDSGMEWFTQTDLFLPYESLATDSGGSWYLCYDQRESGQSIKKDIDWSKSPCTTCDRAFYQNWQAWTKYLEIHPFKVNLDRGTEKDGDGFFTQPATLWDVETNLYNYQTNYGINLQLTLMCDYTDFLLEQKKSFQDVIGLQAASDLIREMAYNPNFRINRPQQNFSRMELLYELDGDSTSMKKSGINFRLANAMKSLKLNTSGLNRVCLPCSNGGIKYRTV